MAKKWNGWSESTQKREEKEGYNPQKFDEGYQSLRAKVKGEFGIGSSRKGRKIDITPYVSKALKATSALKFGSLKSFGSGLFGKKEKGGIAKTTSDPRSRLKTKVMKTEDETAPTTVVAPTGSLAPEKKAAGPTGVGIGPEAGAAPEAGIGAGPGAEAGPGADPGASRLLPGVEGPGSFGITRIARPGESHTEMNARYDRAAAGEPEPEAAEAPGAGGIGKPGAFEDAIKALGDIGKQASAIRTWTSPSGQKRQKMWHPKIAAYAQEAIADILSETYGRQAQAGIGMANVGIGVAKLGYEQERVGIAKRQNELTLSGQNIAARKLLQVDLTNLGKNQLTEHAQFLDELKLKSPKSYSGAYDVRLGFFRMAMEGAPIPSAYRKSVRRETLEFEEFYDRNRGLGRTEAMRQYEDSIKQPMGEIQFPTNTEE